MRLIRLLKNDLARESADWVRDGLLDEAQAEAICARYGADYHQRGSHSLVYKLLLTLGFLFMGTALIILLGANWEEIPRAVRLWGLIALTVGTQSAALYRYQRQSAAGVGLFLLGNIFYGAAIILIAQTYHLGEHMPDGILWWALGSLPFALLTRSPWLMLFTLGLAIIWFFVEAGMGFIPWLLPLFILAAIGVLIKGRQSLLLFLSTVFSIGLLLEYAVMQYWRETFFFQGVHQGMVVAGSLFIFAYAFSHRLRLLNSTKAKDYATTLSLWTLRLAILGLLIFSFADPWEELIRADWPALWALLALLVLLAGAAQLCAWQTARFLPVLALNSAYLALSLGVIWLDNRDAAIYLQVLDNTLLVLAGVGLIMHGIRQGISHYFFLGVFSLLITALLRYIDLIGHYIGGALLFLFFSAVLLAAAKYWQRQNLTIETQREGYHHE